MKKSKIKFLKLVLFYFAITLLFFIWNIPITKSKISNEQIIQNKLPLVLSTPKLLNYDEYCQKYGEWENIENVFYFKRNATYYFIDASFFRLNLIKKATENIEYISLYLNISFIQKSIVKDFKIETKTNRTKWKETVYHLISIDAKFDLIQLLAFKSNKITNSVDFPKKLSIEIIIEIKQINKNPIRSKSSLLAKIKYLFTPHTEKLKIAMICSKCLYFHKVDTNSRNLENWIDLNRKFGYNNIAICNQSISDNSDFKKLFEKNKDFLLVKEMKCVPNLTQKNVNDAYFESYYMLNDIQIAIIDSVILSECYLDYFDTYKYISIIDIDEVIMSKSNLGTFQMINYIKNLDSDTKNLTDISEFVFSNKICNEFQPKTSNRVEEFLNELNLKHFLSSTKSFYFRQAFYISFDLVEKIFRELKSLLEYYQYENNVTKINVQFADKGDFSVNYKMYYLNFTFSISRREFKYAANLLKIYEMISKAQLINVTKNFCKNDFRRVFFIAGKQFENTWGKSIHNTSSVLDFTPHHAIEYVTWNEESYQIDFDKNYLDIKSQSFKVSCYLF